MGTAITTGNYSEFGQPEEREREREGERGREREREADVKFSLDDIWNLFQEDHLPSNNFYRQIINCMGAWNHLQKTLGLPPNTEVIKQTHRVMMEMKKFW